MAQQQRFILREERSFPLVVEGTFSLPPHAWVEGSHA
jgi:hypothetical protein